MGVGESLRRVVGYFSGADDGYDDEPITSLEQFERHYEERLDVRSRGRRRGADYDGIFGDESPAHLRRARERVARPFALARPPHTEFCLVVTQEFDDAQQIADRFRADTPVIINMQSCEAELAERLTDFCSGLTYALEGSLQRIDDKILLLAPRNVELSSEATAGFLKKGFFNQV
jgi:cell division inhibitor SepF